MKIIGKSATGYIAEFNHTEIEKFMNLYYGKMKRLEIGDEVNFGKGFDFHADVVTALAKTREFLYLQDLSEQNRKDANDFLEMVCDNLPDGIDDYLDGWIVYRDKTYHLSEFSNLNNKAHYPNGSPFPIPWNGYISDSYFSGIVIELSEDGEMYRIGTYFS